MEISVNKDGEDLGPFSLEDLQAQLAEGSLTLDDYAWFDGCDDWVYVADVPGIQDEPQQEETNSSDGVYIEQNEAQKGPFPQAQLQTMVSQGVIPMDTPAWMEGWGDWATVADVPGIKKPRVKVSGAANPLASLSATGQKDKKAKKKGKEDSKEEESSESSKSKKGSRTRRKKGSGKKEKKTLKEMLVPILALVLILVLLIGGGLWAWITFFPGDEDDEGGGGIFQSVKKIVKDEPPPEDPWDLADWRRARQR